VSSGGLDGIPCADPGCKQPFPVSVARAHLSAWDRLRIDERETDRNQRVALAAKAVLNCACGTVGIVTDDDVGNGCISCPGCSARYCVNCGNEWHPGVDCPPTAETIAWIDEKTK